MMMTPASLISAAMEIDRKMCMQEQNSQRLRELEEQAKREDTVDVDVAALQEKLATKEKEIAELKEKLLTAQADERERCAIELTRYEGIPQSPDGCFRYAIRCECADEIRAIGGDK